MYFHSKGFKELPPTSESIKNHILRTCFATSKKLYVFETAVDKPDPTSFGYMLDDDLLIPIVGQNPLPEQYTIRCGCKKCATASCPCKQKGVI